MTWTAIRKAIFGFVEAKDAARDVAKAMSGLERVATHKIAPTAF